jgi:hypothetical protein
MSYQKVDNDRLPKNISNDRLSKKISNNRLPKNVNYDLEKISKNNNF